MLESAITSTRPQSSWPEKLEAPRLWPASLIIITSVLLSFGYACAIPFAALAAFAALKLERRNAAGAIGAAWLINQAAGFTCLNYPRTLETFGWGIGMGAAAFAALIVALKTAEYLRRTGGAALTIVTFAAAFTSFKIALLGVGFVSGGSTAFSWLVFGKVLAINAAAVPALLGLNYLGLRLQSRILSWRANRPVALRSLGV